MCHMAQMSEFLSCVPHGTQDSYSYLCAMWHTGRVSCLISNDGFVCWIVAGPVAGPPAALSVQTFENFVQLVQVTVIDDDRAGFAIERHFDPDAEFFG